MKYACLIALLALPCRAYDLTGRVDPPAAVSVFLHGATSPFEASTSSDEDGHFRFGKLPQGTYTLAVATEARGDVLQTIELSPGTVDAKGRLDILLRITAGSLESDGGRGSRAIVSATVLSIPDRATKEYADAQRCLSRRDSECASTHLRRAVEIAPRFTAAWNQLGTLAYQTKQFSDAETDFRRGLDADPEAFEPLVNLGGVLLNLGRPQEALGYNQRAVARRPNDALANSQLGLAHFYLKNLDAAEKYLKIAVQLDPAHFSHPQLTLAEIYVERGDREAAVTEFRDFIRRHPDSPLAPGVRDKIAALSR